MLYQLSYTPIPPLPTAYLVSRWAVWALHLGQNLRRSSRPGSFAVSFVAV